MALIQQAPQNQADVDKCTPLAIPPGEVAEMDEEDWYTRAYQGDDAPQLTLRAIGMGTVLGFFLAFTNLYIGLKTGWHLGVAITACILSFALWSTAEKIGLAKTPMTILENNCMQSTASAAGYSTGGTMVSAIPALLMLSVTAADPTGTHIPWPVLAAWTALLAILGVCLAIPMKRNMINQERLKFPSGLAAATTLQSLYASGEEATRKAKALALSAAFGAAFPLLLDLPILPTFRDAGTGEVTALGGSELNTAFADGAVTGGLEPLLPGHLDLFDWLPALGVDRDTGKAFQPSDWTITWDLNPVMIAAGALVGVRITLWMLIGGLVLAYGVGPAGYTEGWQNALGETVFATSKPYKAWKEIGLWIGAPMMVASGLMSFAFQWRTILRAFQSLRGGEADAGAVDHSDVEVPGSWFAAGALFAGSGVVLLAWQFFEVPPFFGILAVVLTFFLALVAARATGESDITPTGAMGKIMQLTYGVLIPQSATANLMTAGITAGAAGATADLLNDLKSGYLLGANPRRQFMAQAFGIIPGTIATVIGFYALVPDATALTGTADKAPDFPAPAAQAWMAVAKVFKEGIENMHPMHQNAIAVGLLVGFVLVAIEQFVPKDKRIWALPSATGLGLGFILPFQYPLSMFVGALITAAWTFRWPDNAKEYVVPISSGIIAGVSIVGVLAQMLNNFVLVNVTVTP